MNPEANPVVVLDFGAQYSKLIARRVPGVFRMVAAISSLAIILLGCQYIREYRISEINVRDSRGELPIDIGTGNKSLTIRHPSYDIQLSNFYMTGSPPAANGGRFGYAVEVSNKTNQPRQLSIELVTILPLKYKAETGQDDPGPVTIRSLMLRPPEREGEAQPVPVDRMALDPEATRRFDWHRDIDYYLEKGKMRIVIHDHGDDSKISALFVIS